MTTFEATTITIRDRDQQPHEIAATIGVGTGLAYHLLPMENGTGTEYSLSHVRSGYGLTALTVPTPEEAQAWIEGIGLLDMSLPALKRLMRGGNLRTRIELAHERALLPRNTIFMYAFDKDGCPLFPSADATGDEQKDAEIAQSLFDFHGQAATSVVLVEMDYLTGMHTTLHVYERQAQAQEVK